MDYMELASEMLGKMHRIHKNKRQKQIGDFLKGGSMILQIILENGGAVQPNEISSELSVSTARVAAALNNLERKGLIVRSGVQGDRRQIRITLTPEGKEAAELHRLRIQKDVAKDLQALGEQDALEYVRILGRLADAVENSE